MTMSCYCGQIMHDDLAKVPLVVSTRSDSVPACPTQILAVAPYIRFKTVTLQVKVRTGQSIRQVTTKRRKIVSAYRSTGNAQLSLTGIFKRAGQQSCFFGRTQSALQAGITRKSIGCMGSLYHCNRSKCPKSVRLMFKLLCRRLTLSLSFYEPAYHLRRWVLCGIQPLLSELTWYPRRQELT